MRKQSITLWICLVFGVLASFSMHTLAEKPSAFDVVEATISEIQAAFNEGRLTSRELVLLYLARIAYYEQSINAVLAVSHTALAEADLLDQARAEGKSYGPLHGIPIALKDNIQTTSMPTTGGALAFKDFIPPYEATLTKNLREAGAIIIAKTVMSELANWVTGKPMKMPSNYSALGGYSMNPYDGRLDPRPHFNDGRSALSTGGSSSGSGTAASFWTASVGTETSGSILSPSNQNMLVGIKPTVGRVSRYGIIPITADQDTAGPMARTVSDAAILFGVLEGAMPDSNDPATIVCDPPPNRDYTAFLDREGLKGARIGIPRAFYYDKIAPPGGKRLRGGLRSDQAALMTEAIKFLKMEGAVLVDPANIPSIVDPNPQNNFLNWGTCGDIKGRRGQDSNCSIVLKYGMKRDFNIWLSTLGSTTPVKTLSDLRQFNLSNRSQNAIRYGQVRLDISDEVDVVADKLRYQVDRKKDIYLTATHGIDEVMQKYRLDALLFPGKSGANMAARPGYPTVIVPFGQVSNIPKTPFPEDFEAKPAPFGVSFTGTACSEGTLIKLAYAFEQATQRRTPPLTDPTHSFIDQHPAVLSRSDSSDEDRFVGVWKFVARESRRSNGEILPSKSPFQRGFIIYTATGHVAVQLLRDTRQAYPIDQPTGEQAQAALENYIAYYGDFTVDQEKGTVTHHRQAHINPAQETDAVRSYAFLGNRLMLTLPSSTINGEEVTTSITWERVE